MSEQALSVGSPIGLEFSRYHAIEEIGRGGMGVVFRTRDQHLDREMATDVSSTGTVTDEEGRKNFRKGARALSRVNHPTNAAIYDFDTQGSMDFLVKECTLEQIRCGRLLQREERCSTSQKLLRELKSMRSLFAT
jgi:serine/threonine protein kinase